LPLRGVTTLVRGERGCTRLDVPAAQRVLIGGTAGTRAFAPAQLDKHLAFCAILADSVPVYRLGLRDAAGDPVAAALDAFADGGFDA
jgi:hypothetical protein